MSSCFPVVYFSTFPCILFTYPMSACVGGGRGGKGGGKGGRGGEGGRRRVLWLWSEPRQQREGAWVGERVREEEGRIGEVDEKGNGVGLGLTLQCRAGHVSAIPPAVCAGLPGARDLLFPIEEYSSAPSGGSHLFHRGPNASAPFSPCSDPPVFIFTCTNDTRDDGGLRRSRRSKWKTPAGLFSRSRPLACSTQKITKSPWRRRARTTLRVRKLPGVICRAVLATATTFHPSKRRHQLSRPRLLPLSLMDHASQTVAILKSSCKLSSEAERKTGSMEKIHYIRR